MPLIQLVYPHPAGTSHTYISGGVPGGLHETAGLPNNWALDFMAPGGTRFLAPFAGTVTRFSGHNPAEGVIDGSVYGWNLYVEQKNGVWIFVTHLENRVGPVGRKVKPGDILGHVGHWPHDPGRSHTHLGVTHPGGVKAAKAYVCRIAEAPHVHGTWPQTKEAA
jgi:murein DD-endopeptidase MepM/ murein hydrolase activator NlpD